MSKVEAFTLHNNRGQSVLERNLHEWVDPTNPQNDVFAPVIRYSWRVDDIDYETPRPENRFWYLLPDGTGFICFERGQLKPNNCLLLDAYGKERIRLNVPWQLTRNKNPESAISPTHFASDSVPYINPTDGKQGEFGVTAWVEHAGKYYFELDYHTGQFLWGKEIRD